MPLLLVLDSGTTSLHWREKLSFVIHQLFFRSPPQWHKQNPIIKNPMHDFTQIKRSERASEREKEGTKERRKLVKWHRYFMEEKPIECPFSPSFLILALTKRPAPLHCLFALSLSLECSRNVIEEYYFGVQVR
jgi:hypothetical protein